MLLPLLPSAQQRPARLPPSIYGVRQSPACPPRLPPPLCLAPRLNYGPTPFNDGTQPGSTGINGIHISVVSTSSSQAVVNVCYFRYARESDAEGGCDNGVSRRPSSTCIPTAM